MDLLSGVPWNPNEAIATVARRHYETHGHLPPSWAGTEKKIVANDFHMGFTTPIRWNGDGHARVITGGSLCTVLHPTKNRLITHREAARIIGFPDSWKIRPLRHVPAVAATWGKGITVDCGRWIGSWIREALDGSPGTHRGISIGEREWDIDVTHAYRNLIQ
jgi:site-specific DNA-cytosine methylase